MVSDALRLPRAGEPANVQGYQVKNRLLRGMPDNEFRMVRSRLEFVKLPHHMVLHKPKRRLRRTSIFRMKG